MLVDLPRLEREYYERRPDPDDPAQLVSFGTSGHRGSSAARHLQRGAHPGDHPGDLRLPAARRSRAALYGQGHARAVRAGAAHGARGAGGQRRGDRHPARRRRDADAGHLARHPRLQSRPQRRTSPTASSSRPRTIRRRTAASSTTRPTAGRPTPTSRNGSRTRANELLRGGNAGVKRVPFAGRHQGANDASARFHAPYVEDLRNVIDMEAIRAAGLKLAVDPLGGAAAGLLGADQRDLRTGHHRRESRDRSDVLVHDRRSRRQDPHGLLEPLCHGAAGRLKDQYRVAFANDPDADRHGIVTPSAGLMNPNHYLAVAIRLPAHAPARLAGRRGGRQDAGQQQHDRPSGDKLGRRLLEVPVGFKWFAPGLFDGSCCFGGEESAGASFLRRDGTVWTTDKDGPIMDLLAAEITARTGKDPGEHYRRADGASSARRTTRASMRRRRRSRRRSWQKLSPEASRTRAWRASRSPRS